VSTKVGRLLGRAAIAPDHPARFGFHSSMPFEPYFDYSYDGVMRSWQDSLQRMELPRIDVLYIHDIGRLTHGPAHSEFFHQLTHGGGLRALQALRSDRAIAAFGIGVNEVAVCLDLLQETDLDVILLAGRYTLLEQDALDDLLPECARRGISIVIGGPYNSGILVTGVNTGGVTPRFNYEPAPPEVVARVRAIELTARRWGVPLPAAALQFPLAHPLVTSVVPGIDSPRGVAQTMEWYRTPIPGEFWKELQGAGLLRPDAPIPGSA
jgi:D-threo-aldose 1-dehydrogenase